MILRQKTNQRRESLLALLFFKVFAQSLPLSLCFTYPFSLSHSLSLSVRLCLCVCACVCVCMFLSHSKTLSLSLFHSFPLTHFHLHNLYKDSLSPCVNNTVHTNTNTSAVACLSCFPSGYINPSSGLTFQNKTLYANQRRPLNIGV